VTDNRFEPFYESLNAEMRVYRLINVLNEVNKIFQSP
jgi:hypothetical protein